MDFLAIIVLSNNNKIMTENPRNYSARSQHSLKTSQIFDNQRTLHLNQASNQIGFNKKHSLTSKHQTKKVENIQGRDNSNQFKFQKGNILNIQQHQIISLQHKTDNIISLGNRGRQTAREYLTGPPELSSHNQTKEHIILQRLDLIAAQFQSYERRLKKFQEINSQNHSKNDFKQILASEIKDIMIKQQKKIQEKFNLEKQTLKSEAKMLRIEIEKSTKRFSLEQANCVGYNQQKFHKMQVNIKEILVHMKNSLYKELLEIENKVHKNRKKDIQALRQQFQTKIVKIQKKSSQQKIFDINLKPVTADNTSEESNKSKDFDKMSTLFHNNIDLLTNNPYLRLKFFGKLVLLGTEVSNPEHELELQTVQRVYRIDKEGFLLDEQNRYLMDSKNRLIHLDEEQIKILQKNQMLHGN